MNLCTLKMGALRQNPTQITVRTAHLTVCLWLCTISVHNTAQNSSDNLPNTASPAWKQARLAWHFKTMRRMVSVRVLAFVWESAVRLTIYETFEIAARRPRLWQISIGLAANAVTASLSQTGGDTNTLQRSRLHSDRLSLRKKLYNIVPNIVCLALVERHSCSTLAELHAFDNAADRQRRGHSD